MDAVGDVEIVELRKTEFDIHLVDRMFAGVEHREVQLQRLLFIVIVILGVGYQVLGGLDDVG